MTTLYGALTELCEELLETASMDEDQRDFLRELLDGIEAGKEG